MAKTAYKERQLRRRRAAELLAEGLCPADAASRLTTEWRCSRRTSLRDVALAQGELATALDSVEQRMVGWMATQYQRLAARAEADKQFSAAVGALNALRSMLIQPQLDAQFAAHHRGHHTHQAYRR